MDFPSIEEPAERPYVSTGHLPEPDMVQQLVSGAHQRFKSNADGQNPQVYPALARVPGELFGIRVAGTSGRIYEAGDTEYEFSIMSVSKPFVFALVCETIGPEEAHARLGAKATGLLFNSLAASQTNYRNRSIARLLQSCDRICCDADEVGLISTSMRGKGRPEKENNNGCNRPSNCALGSDGRCRCRRHGRKPAA